jgi:hypothetical protein
MIMKYKDLGTMLSKDEMKNVKGGYIPPDTGCKKVGAFCDPLIQYQCCPGLECGVVNHTGYLCYVAD